MIKLLMALDAYLIFFNDGPWTLIGMMVLTPIIIALLALKLPGIIAGIVRPQKIM